VDRTRTLTDASIEDPRGCEPSSSIRRRSVFEKPYYPTTIEGSSVSFTTLAAPRDAKKAYEKAGRELLKKRPDYPKAAEKLEKAVRLYPRYAAAWYLLGRTRLSLHQEAVARRAFERALVADPRYPDPYLPLALMELKLGRLAEASELTDRVLKLNPHLAEAHFYRAVAYYGLSESDTAKQSIRVILEAGKDKLYPRVHVMLGEMYVGERDFPSAEAEYRRFLELEPASQAADAIRNRLKATAAVTSER
jgi:tetratricopeptide (TPR) repeat protein